MAILMVCTCGQEMVTEDEHAGRKVRCPNCQGIIIVPGERRAPVRPVGARREVDEDDDYAPRSGGVSKSEGLHRARIGLGLHWGKSLCFLIISALGLLSSLIFLIMTLVETTRSGPPRGDSGALVVLTVGLLFCLSGVAYLVMPVLSAVGSLLCFWLPPRTGGRILSMVACGLDTFAFFFLCVVYVVYFSTVGSVMSRGGGFNAMQDIFEMGRLVTVLGILVMILMLAGWILHMLVLKGLAQYRRYYSVGGDAIRMLVIGLVTVLIPPLLIWVMGVLLGHGRAGRAGLFVVEFLAIAWMGGLLGVSIKMLNLTSSVRHML